MNRWVFNFCMLLGLVMTAVGVGVQFGVGAGLTVAGVLLLVLTLYASRLAAGFSKG